MRPSQRPCWLFALLALLIQSVAANIATFNVSDITKWTRANATGVPVGLVTVFELRTSHPGGSVWGLFGLSTDNSSDIIYLKIGLTGPNLTLDGSFINSPRQIAANVTDGRWHSVKIHLYANTSSSTVSVDGISQLQWNAHSWTLINWTVMTFGGVNGSDGLRGCLANASVTRIFNNDVLNATSVVEFSGTVNATACIEDPCLCANGGSCLPSPRWNLHSGCNCTGTGFGGDFCLVAKDFCNASGSGGDPCSGHGHCISIAKNETFICNCTDGYIGSNCSTPPATIPSSTTMPTPTTTPTPTITTLSTARQPATPAPQSDTRLVVGLVVGLLLLLLAGTGAGLAFKIVRDRRKDSGVYKPYDREVGGVKSGQRSAQDILRPPNEERLI